MHDVDQRWEILLARLFVDAELRARLRADPGAVAGEHGLDAGALASFAGADWAGLDLAARSYRHKRAGRAARRRGWRAIFRLIST